jgi:hypothetical protein
VSTIAFLILAHKPVALRYLLRAVSAEHLIFVHLDARVSVGQHYFEQRPNVHWESKRLPVFWGGFNMISATRNLIRSTFERAPHVKRLVLISGDSLPIASSDMMAFYKTTWSSYPVEKCQMIQTSVVLAGKRVLVGMVRCNRGASITIISRTMNCSA